MTGLLTIAAIFVLGIGAQWIAWRFRVPSILLLLILGFLAGPVTGLLDHVMLQGEWLFTFVGVSVGIILFEGGLSLKLDELTEVGGSVVRLITIGVLTTWVLSALAAYHVLAFNASMSILIGALLTVTGPTVIIPLLRQIRPSGRVATIAKWEGITIDPIGAILAVLVLEAVLLVNAPGPSTFVDIATHAAQGLLLEAFVGVSAGLAGAASIVLLLHRRMVPDFLQNATALMVVVAVFAAADTVAEESGLVATTIMGIAVANQRYVSVRRIIEFKEDLRVLLISVLFIVLTARLHITDLDVLGWTAVAFLAILILVVRPAAVFLSTMGMEIDLNEQVFLSWLAPRGIVAAAVAALFSFRLEDVFPEEAAALVPIVFLVIGGTVAVYGLSASWLARRLGLADQNPQGVLFVGAPDWSRSMAGILKQHGFNVLMVDSNPQNVRLAQDEGIPATRGNILSEQITDKLDLSGIGRMLAMTPNDEVNSLAVLHFTQTFDSADVYQLTPCEEQQSGTEKNLSNELRGRPLFGHGTHFTTLSERCKKGAEVRSFDITEDYTYKQFTEEYGDRYIPLFVIRSWDELTVFSEQEHFTEPARGHILVALVDAA